MTPALKDIGYSSRTSPRPHQEREFLKWRDAPARCLAWEMRSGKSKAIIDLAEYLFAKDEIEGLLVIAPNGVHENWVHRELPFHCATPYVAAAYRASSASARWFKAKFEEVQRKKQRPGTLQVFCINAESIRTEKGKAHIADFIRGRNGRFLLCVDESHMFRTPASSRTRVAKALAKQSAYRRIMTGTLSSNSPLHVWSQFEILQPGALGFSTFGAFKRAYAIIGQSYASGRSFEEIRGYQNLDDLKERISKWSSVVTKKDAGINPVHPIVRRVSMHPKIQKAYTEFAKNCMIGDLGFEGAARATKLQQISRGWYYDVTGEPVDIVPLADNSLLNALVAEIEGTRGKVIVWGRFRHDLDLISLALRKAKISFVSYRGGLKSDDKAMAVNRFTNDPAVKVFLGEPSTGGVGLPLHAADCIMWHSHTYDNIVREQADERASVVGDKVVDRVDFSVDRSISDEIIKALNEKRDLADTLSGNGLKNMLLMEELV